MPTTRMKAKPRGRGKADGVPYEISIRIFTLDPSVSVRIGGVATVNVPYEVLEPGPVGSLLELDPEGAPPPLKAGRLDLDHPYPLQRRRTVPRQRAIPSSDGPRTRGGWRSGLSDSTATRVAPPAPKSSSGRPASSPASSPPRRTLPCSTSSPPRGPSRKGIEYVAPPRIESTRCARQESQLQAMRGPLERCWRRAGKQQVPVASVFRVLHLRS